MYLLVIWSYNTLMMFFFGWKVEGESCFMDIVEFPEIIISVKKKISCGK